MKKINYISILLCVCLLLQCFLLPVCATAVEDADMTEGGFFAAETEIPPATEEPAFGTVCIQRGCRTINGQIPLAGSDPRLATAQSVFLYEELTDTVIYAYNPDAQVHPGSLAKILLAMIVLEKICRAIDVDFGDIIQYVTEEK